MLEFWLNVASA